MKIFKLIKYPKQIYLLWIVSFLFGLDVMSSFVIAFYKDWGGISQFQTQILQSWFMFLIFIFEVPTGLIGDVRGRKFSVTVGALFAAVGFYIYGLSPNFILFLAAEAVVAVGVAFWSGAREALLFDTCKEKKLEKEYPIINGISSNLGFVGMVAGVFLSGLIVKTLPFQYLTQIQGLNFFITFLFLLIFIREPRVKHKGDLEPHYMEVFKNSINTFKNSKALLKNSAFMVSIISLTYFCYWLYQNILRDNNLDQNFFPIYRFYNVIFGMIAVQLIAFIFMKTKRKRVLFRLLSFLMALGFSSPIIFKSVPHISLIILLAFTGAIGIRFKEIFSPVMNSHINSKERATVLSFVSMITTLAMAVLNPIVGYFADVSVYWTFVVLGMLLLGVTIFMVPKEEELQS